MINKRKSLLLLVTLITICLLNTTSFAKETATREKYNFNFDWIFSKGVGKENAGATASTKSEYPLTASDVVVIPSSETPYSNEYVLGSTWENVSLPHTYNDVDTFDNYTEAGMNGERSVYSGTAWYKKTFTVTNEMLNKKLYIEFEAARQAADVYINGTKLNGKCENGFIPFGYDITPYVVEGENDITVMVDNSFPYKDASGNAVVWHDSHWHPNYGGLYRNVYLYVTDPLHLTLPLYSFLQSEGTYVYTSDENATSAKVNIDAQVENNYDVTKTFKLVAYIKDMEGNIVGEPIESTTQEIASGEKVKVLLERTLTNPKRWSTEYPYLYTVECQVVVGDTTIDKNETTFGIRTFRNTTDYGFYLNENYIKLTGWGQKATNEWAGLGAAYPDWMQSYTIKLMKEANGNFIRWGHVAGSPAQIKSSDEYGLLVMQPGVDGEGNYSGTYTSSVMQIRLNAFRDMIIYYRNNPSIIMWEIGNQASSLSETYLQQLKGLVDTYDYGNRKASTVNSGTYDNTISTSDRLISIRQSNSTSKNYVDVTETTQGSGGMSGKTFVEGEYNRYEARRGVWDTYTEGFENYKSAATSGYTDFTSEMFSKTQISDYNSMIGSTSHPGGANWIFSDSTSHGRLYEEVARASGEVDATRLTKDAYYVCQVLFSKTPACHIIGHWNYKEGTTKTIYVVAKGADAVQLYINDTLKATSTTKTNGYMYTFSNIAFENGKIEARALKESSVVATHTITSHGTPTALKITTVNTEPLYANGSDILLLDVEVVDGEGNRCSTYDGATLGKITTFTVNDHEDNPAILEEDETAIWRGGYNSNIEKSTNSKSLYVEAGVTRVALRTTMNAGNIIVTAAIDGLTSDTETVTAIPVTNINGYSLSMPTLLSYTYTGETTYGDGAKLGEVQQGGEEEPPVTGYTSALIKDFAYTGVHDASIQESMQNGARIYNDEEINFISVPHELQGAEYIQTANNDKASLNAELISFNAKKNIEIFVLWDPMVEIPTWLEGFTLDDDIATTDDGIIMQIYKQNLTAEEGITIPASGVNGKKGNMMSIAIKAADATLDFINDHFDDYDAINKNPSGWNIEAVADAPIKVEVKPKDEDVENTALHLLDNVKGQMSYIYKEFPIQTNNKVELSFDAYIDSSKANDWIRVWLHDGDLPVSTTAKDHVVIESYFHHDTSHTPASNYKMIYKGINTAGSENELIDSNIEMNVWHSFKYVIDLKAQTFSVQVDNDSPVENLAFRQNTHSMNYIIFGTGSNAENDFYIDNVKISPIVEGPISAINIGETSDALAPISQFSIYTKEYLEKFDTTNKLPVVTVTPGTTYGDAPTIQIDKTRVKISGTDKNGVAYEYQVYFSEFNLVDIEVTSNIIESALCTAQISSNIKHNKLLAVDKEMYIGENPPTFTGIPHELLSAEYFTLQDDTTYNRGVFKFTTCKNVDMFVFRDSCISDTTKLKGYTETNSIVTGSNGHVYIVYKKSVPSGTEVTVSLEDEVNNNPSNIIALKESILVENKTMQYEDFTNNFTNDMIEKSWGTTKISDPKVTDNSKEKAYIEQIDDQNVLSIESGELASMILFYKEIPKLYDKYTVTYTARVDGTNQNKFMRVFLQQGTTPDPTYGNDGYTFNKQNVVFESYLHDKDGDMNETKYADVDMYYRRYHAKESDTYNLYPYINIPNDKWIQYRYDVDMINQKVKVYIHSEDDTINFTSDWLDISKVDERDELTYTDHIVFGSAYNGLSKISLKNMEIEPIARTSVVGIKATDANSGVTTIEHFDPLTTDYLLRIPRIEEKPTISLSLLGGTKATVAAPIEHSNYTEITVTDKNEGELDFDTTYKVYFVSVDRTELLTALNTANELTESEYSNSTWSELESVVTAGQAVYDNDSATQLEINIAKENIINAIEALKPNKTALQTALNNVTDLIGSLGINPGYTQSSYNTLVNEYETGKSVYDSETSTKTQISSAVTDINNAIDNLVVDKTALNNKITEAKQTYGDGTNTTYTQLSWATLKNAITHAETEYSSSSSTITSVNTEILSLTNALSGLTVADNTKPTCTITASTEDTTNASSIIYTFTFNKNINGFAKEDITLENGTKGSFTETTANKVYTLVVTNTEACTQKISIAANVCEDASGNKNIAASKTIIIALTDLTALNASKQSANTIYGAGINPGYTVTTWNTLGTAITNANAINGRNTVTEVSNAKTDLDNAINGLLVDKTQLDSRITYATTLVNTNYTNVSWDNLQSKVLAAQTVYADSEATIQEVQNALNTLNIAINNLVSNTSGTTTSGSSTVSKTALKAALKNAKEYNEEDYTDTSWKILEQAIRIGEMINNSSRATKSQVTEATDIINDAIKSLVLKENEQESETLFNDIENHWAKASINNLAKQGLFSGIGDKKFGPELLSTRGMIITVLYRLEKEPENTTETQYDDVDKTSYYSKAIIWGRENKIVNGIGDNKYAPERNVTREEFVTIIYKYVMNKKGDIKVDQKALENYKDKKDISEYAITPMCWAIENGIVKGRSENEIVPKANATRAELVTMMERLITYTE